MSTDFDEVAYRDTIEEMSTAQLTQLDYEAERLAGKLAAINEQRRLIRNVLRTINPPEPKPAAEKPKRGKPGTHKQIGEAKLQMVREFLLVNAPEVDVTTRFLMDEMGLGKDQAGIACKLLRDEGFLRLAGRSSARGAPSIYRLMNPEAVSANGH